MDPEEIYPLATWNSDGTGITATEVAQRLKEAEKARSQNWANAYRDAFCDHFIAEFAQTKPVVRTDGVVAAPFGVPDESRDDADYLLLERIFELPELIMSHGYPVSDISVMLPEESYVALLALAEAEDLAVNPTPFDPVTLLRARFFLIGIEVLCGGRLVTEPVAIFARLGAGVDANSKALLAKIQRCLTGGRVGKLPKSTSGDRVSPSAEPIGKIPVTPSPAGGDDRDSNSLAHLSDEAKVIAAKHAIAAYARNKQLPSAAHLALFGELDRAKASGGAAAVGVDLAKPGADKSVRWWAFKKAVRGPVALPTSDELRRGYGGLECDFIVFDEAANLDFTTGRWHGVKWVKRGAPANINRHAHRLSSESLSRAADQIWGAHSGAAYGDLIGSRPERLAEMIYRGDTAADRERAE